MVSKDDPLWFAQQLVDTLQREVAQKEAELALLISHRAKLLLAFSTPTFPPGYTPSGSQNAEDSNRLDDQPETSPGLTLDDPGLSRRHPKQKFARRPVVKQTIPLAPRISSQTPPTSQSRGSGSESETSDDSQHTRNTIKKQGRNKPTRQQSVVLDAAVRGVHPRSCDPEEPLETSESNVQPSPASETIRNPSKFAVVNWTQQIKERTATSINDSSTDTGDSVSSDGSEDKGVSKSVQITNPGKTPTSAARFPKAPFLSSDAPPEERFDWEVLGVSGPWSPDRSSSLLANSCWSQLQKQPSPLPCKFQTIDEYKSSFEGLIFQECKAHLNSSWEIYQAPTATNQNAVEILGIPEDRNQSSMWQFRPMYPSSYDPFRYIEAEQIEGMNTRLDKSEAVLLSHNNTKSLAIVTLTNYKGVLLRTRMELPAAGGQCALLRMANMVTLKRQYVSLCRASEMWNPLQQQLLNPLEGSKLVFSSSSYSYQEDVKASPSNRASAWRKEKLFNKKQLAAVEGLLRLQQGFLLIQGPPGTGKTSTIVGIVSAMRIEEPRARILVCASSNAAVDEIVSRLMHHMYNQDGKSYSPRRGTLVRLGVEKSIQTACLAVSLDKFVQSSVSALNFSTIKKDTIAEAFIVCCTISGSGHQVFDEVKTKFDLLIIDEAAQAQESEILIALLRVKGRCVMIGDPCQLPAVVIQRPGKAYGRSLFERMRDAGRPALLMTTQYRMHPLISKFPSATFYEGRLKDSPQSRSMLSIFKEDNQEKGIDICGYSFKLGAYCFLDVTWGMEQEEVAGHSISNVDEAEVVATVVQGVVRSLKEGVGPNIGVITPYLAQRSVIIRNLVKHGVDENACEVNTVDGFQGREKDVIILSCVRAHAEHGLGFVSDVRRMNVALTRAKHSLIIVGHAVTLQRQSPAWDSLVEDAITRGLFQTFCPGIPPNHSNTTRMDTGWKDAASGQANVPYGRPPSSSHRRFEKEPIEGRTERGDVPRWNRFGQKSHSHTETLQQSNHSRFEQELSVDPAAGRDVDQTEAEQRPSRSTFEEEMPVTVANLHPSNDVGFQQPLSVVCNLEMGRPNLNTGDKANHNCLKRKAGDQGFSAKRGRPIKVEIEEVEDHCTRNPKSIPIVQVMSAPVGTRQVPAVPSEAPAVGRTSRHITNSQERSGWQDSLSPGSITVKEEIQYESLYSQYPPSNRGNWPVEAVYHDRDESSTMELSEEYRGSFPRGRGRGRDRGQKRGRGLGRHSGSARSNNMSNRMENAGGREQNRSRQGDSVSCKPPSKGWHRGRGKFSRPLR